ncbi:MAG TPA: LuxR C-terminal-related transcriptional regulator [Mycobacteriales bacterium]|jgi:DNA-binding CsgD family transcriptional regulator|nr:LuxR C-terminal-related transcriptional regulator [Mycobacteriales bacterium]
MRPVPEQQSRPSPVLVCAVPEPGGEPRVVLADGSYESGGERVYWRRTPDAEVLRLPLDATVALRPVRRFPDQRPPQSGEERLLAALAAHRPATPAPVVEDAGLEPLRGRLVSALTDGDVAAAEAVAALLWRQHGLAGAHHALATCLADAGSAWAAGEGTVLAERRRTVAARTVLERLRATSSAVADGPLVLLVVPAGDRHTLALTALAHQLQEAGHRTLVAEDLPRPELLDLLAEQRVAAVVVSAHVPLAAVAARQLAVDVRAASPTTLVAVGGPGAPRATRGLDLISDDPAELLALLTAEHAVLTPRECDVLREVADGRTNSEIASALGLSPATVKTHLDHVFAKTGTEHRAAAVARALRQGWIT